LPELRCDCFFDCHRFYFWGERHGT
jgi:hypothetical protein